MSENLITPAGVRRIQLELLWLRQVERPKIVAEVAYAASLGDRSDNAEYRYGKKRLRQIDSRLGYLITCLNKIRIIDPGAISAERVAFGATVVLEDEDEVVKTYRLYGVHEVDVDAGILSHRSPIARALMGKAAGDGINFQAPGGMREFEILEVRYEAQEPVPDPEWLTAAD